MNDGRFNMDKYREMLEKKQAELQAAVRRRDEIAIEKTADQIDEIQRAAERELAIRNLDRDSNLLRHIREALGRIKDGTYGICGHCEEEISPKRLAAVPWAAFCIHCQEAVDRSERNGFDSGDLLNAA